MGRRLFGIGAAVAIASAAMFASVGPASGAAVNSLMVDKVVSGAVPSGTVFTVEVSCDTAANQTLHFNATGHPSAQNGDPITAPVITPAATDSCTVNETVNGGASVVYACAVGNNSVRATCSNDNKGVAYSDTNQGAATITITNTFVATTTTSTTTTTTTTAAQPISTSPSFTG